MIHSKGHIGGNRGEDKWGVKENDMVKLQVLMSKAVYLIFARRSVRGIYVCVCGGGGGLSHATCLQTYYVHHFI